MHPPKGATIISASRRTDIPGCYTQWFLDQIDQGFFTITNPFNRKQRQVDARPEAVHSIVFWSKNFGPFLDARAHRILADKGYQLFFNFTVNSRDSVLEPAIPDTDQRIDQAARLCHCFGPDQIAWRFDPICFFRKNGIAGHNLAEFYPIAQALSRLGITRCVTSFYDPYKKVGARLERMRQNHGVDLTFTEPGHPKKQEVIQRMAKRLADLGMTLYLCCEADLFAGLENTENIRQNACIDGALLKACFGGTPETAKDYGQRRKKGCNCTRSVDVGSYDTHPCPHNCLFCYAHPLGDTARGFNENQHP